MDGYPLPLSTAELEEIERRCNAAGPAPWKSYIEGRDHTSGENFIRLGDGEDLYLTGATVEAQDFIAAARQDIPRLAGEIRRLRSLLQQEGKLQPLHPDRPS